MRVCVCAGGAGAGLARVRADVCVCVCVTLRPFHVLLFRIDCCATTAWWRCVCMRLCTCVYVCGYVCLR